MKCRGTDIMNDKIQKLHDVSDLNIGIPLIRER